MPEEILLMDNITKVYANGFVANKDVTLSVNKGEIHALCGENGAGKSTLMKVLFGTRPPKKAALSSGRGGQNQQPPGGDRPWGRHGLAALYALPLFDHR